MICRKCAREICQQFHARFPIPRVCQYCGCQLDPKNARIPPNKPYRWFCSSCREKLLDKPMDACYKCGTPFTHRGYVQLRHAQSDPSQRKAYQIRAQGRKVA